MIEHLKWLIILSVVLSTTVGLWFIITYWLTPHLKNPDGKARFTGPCGDTMELYLKFRKDRVVESAYWTDGCIYSLNCLSSAAELAKGKNPDEILEIDADLIQETIGGLPRDQIHCAQLAVETLQFAVEDYMLRSRTRPALRAAHSSKGKSRPPAFENGDRDTVQLTS